MKIVSALIEHQMNGSLEEKDHATASMPQWFMDEQVEGEANAQSIGKQLKMAGTEGGKGLLSLTDKDQGARVYNPPMGQKLRLFF